VETVLIISDDAEFARTIMARWQTERSVPAFTVVDTELSKGTVRAAFDLAIVGLLPAVQLNHVLSGLNSNHAPVICVSEQGGASHEVRSVHSRAMVVRQHDGWADTVVLLGSEILKRVNALAKLAHAEQSAAANQRLATLGRFMLEMRHSFNNALTSVLGNAELLLMEPGAFSADVRAQIDTIQTMALRMHEIIQRFSSLETEMNFAEKSSQNETSQPSHAFAIRF
jgi:signal transduction histidine kinase